MSRCTVSSIPSRDSLGQDISLTRDRQIKNAYAPTCRNATTAKHHTLACHEYPYPRLEQSHERVKSDACTREAVQTTSSSGVKVPFL